MRTDDLLPGFTHRAGIRDALNVKSDRTIRRYELLGMPYVTAGGRFKLYNVARVREWLEAREVRLNTRRRGSQS